jgi:hypothetical protein
MLSGLKKIFSASDKQQGLNGLLTGIPRSGTTLACRLLCECEQTVALNEPLDRTLFPNRQAALTSVEDSFVRFRSSLLKSGTAPARTVGGKITDNAFAPDSPNRERVVERTEVHFDQNLANDFTLILKHNAEFTLLLPEIAERYHTVAMVRNPLAVLASWCSVDVPVSRGKVAKAGRLRPDFEQAYSSIDQLLERQLFILDWYFQQYVSFPEERVLRYEELIQTQGLALEKVAKKPLEKTWTLEQKNTNPLYDSHKIVQAGEILLKREGHFWSFYDKSDVERLLHLWTR